jgi:hypothetical protein
MKRVIQISGASINCRRYPFLVFDAAFVEPIEHNAVTVFA